MFTQGDAFQFLLILIASSILFWLAIPLIVSRTTINTKNIKWTLTGISIVISLFVIVTNVVWVSLLFGWFIAISTRFSEYLFYDKINHMPRNETQKPENSSELDKEVEKTQRQQFQFNSVEEAKSYIGTYLSNSEEAKKWRLSHSKEERDKFDDAMIMVVESGSEEEQEEMLKVSEKILKRRDDPNLEWVYRPQGDRKLP